VVDVPTVPMFDWRQLRRWGISESQLPPRSFVGFKEPTFWEQYKRQIIGFISLSVVEALLIVGLLVQGRRRKRVEEALAEKGSRLRESQAIAHLGSFHWDVAADTVVWSDELYRIYGLKPGESSITYKTYLQQVHSDHRKQVRSVVEQAIATCVPFEHE